MNLKNILIVILSILLIQVGQLNASQITSDQSVGGSKDDVINSTIQTSDGDYISVGYSYSDQTGDITDHNQDSRYSDCLISKTDQDGNIIFTKLYGGPNLDGLYQVIETTDNNFIAAGYTNGAGGDVQSNPKGAYDCLLIKFDQDGNIIWDKTYGGSSGEMFFNISATNDGGYVAVGESAFGGGDITDPSNNPIVGYTDGLIVKFDQAGNQQWNQMFGGSDYDQFNDVIQLQDGSYIAVGSTKSNDGEITNTNNTGQHGLLTIFDQSGIEQANFTFNNSTEFNQIIVDQDGNLYIAGNIMTTKYEDNMQYQTTDGILTKLDQSYNLIWQQQYGNIRSDNFTDLLINNQGNIIVSGYLTIDNQTSQGNKDGLIIEYDQNGNIITESNYGGNQAEQFNSIIQITDNQYVASGYSESNQTGNLTDPNNGMRDGLIIKTTL